MPKQMLKNEQVFLLKVQTRVTARCLKVPRNPAEKEKENQRMLTKPSLLVTTKPRQNKCFNLLLENPSPQNSMRLHRNPHNDTLKVNIMSSLAKPT